MAGIVPGTEKNGLTRLVMTMSTQNLSVSAVFKAVYGMQADDPVKIWVTLRKLDTLAPCFEVIDGKNNLLPVQRVSGRVGIKIPVVFWGRALLLCMPLNGKFPGFVHDILRIQFISRIMTMSSATVLLCLWLRWILKIYV